MQDSISTSVPAKTVAEPISVTTGQNDKTYGLFDHENARQKLRNDKMRSENGDTNGFTKVSLRW
jgi:hypothetical protein